jgi:signal transduction histidine kinase/CheY-like chemotaxis protein/HPt (histidine-containing phosphotransfer) domain-containing protein
MPAQHLTTSNSTDSDPADLARARDLFRGQWQANARRTDRMFAVLMVLQWAAAIAVSLILSPWTWNGSQWSVHPHVWLSLTFGGALTSLPVYLAWRNPGQTLTRHVIAIAQILFSSLLIHVTGGRIETHFHVFGSLAFLAFYRDWRVLVPATVLVALDHFVRGVWWPETVFGIATASPWRWLEHAGWVLFEDVFLVMACRHGVRDLWESASRTAELERINREIRAAKEAAETASRAKSDFLANMSHEIRTPLNGILGFAAVLMNEPDTEPATQHEYLQTIHDSGRHLATLINDILDLSKIESEQVTIEHTRCSPHEIVAETVSILRVRAQERGLNLEYFWKSDVPESIETDPNRLRQILMNLIGNAIKFTEVGSVQVAARLQQGDDPRLVIDVIDTGVGIRPECLRTIFDPFVQADSSITRRFGGTGLGLSISRKLSRLLGGELTVNSEPGRGSIFTVTIPTGPLDDVSMLRGSLSDMLGEPPAAVRQTPHRLPPCQILLVEDGVTNRKLISLVLERAGATVRCAENGRAGVEAAEQGSFDLILMDMQMPVMDGYSAARELRWRGHATPILALTAHAMRGDMQNCLDAGCTAYLSKPIDPSKLLEAIADLLAGRSLPDPRVESPLPRGSSAALVSTLPAGDAEFREIVEQFVRDLAERLCDLQAAHERADRKEIASIAHWIKGAGGTAGFDALTQPAAALEMLARNAGSPEQLGRAIDDLQRLFDRIAVPAGA